MKLLLIKLIELYQRTLSPDTGWPSIKYPGGYCKYVPHCSEYAKQAIMKRGAVVGSFLAIWRILRCNPWSKGGYDPVE
jgi:putative membrane protein insertion efficiency factor